MGDKYCQGSAMVQYWSNMHGALVLIPSSTHKKQDRRDSPDRAHVPGRPAQQIQFVKCSTTFKGLLPLTTQPGTHRTPRKGLQGRAVTDQLFPHISRSRCTFCSSPTKKTRTRWQDIRWLLEAASHMDWPGSTLGKRRLKKNKKKKQHILPWS